MTENGQAKVCAFCGADLISSLICLHVYKNI